MLSALALACLDVAPAATQPPAPPTYMTHWGTLGTGPSQFNGPDDVAVDADGNVYVTDHYNARVQKFTSAGTFIREWGQVGSGPGEFESIDGITIASGIVYVAELDNHRISKFTTDGDFVGMFGEFGSGPGQFNRPSDVVVDAGGILYVSDAFNGRIQKLTSTGGFIASWGSLGSAPGQMDSPSRLALDGIGNIFVSDLNNSRVQKFTTDGALVEVLAGSGPPWSFARPIGIATDPMGNVYVAEEDGHRLRLFTNDGAFIFSFGTPGSGPGQMYRPFGIATDACAARIYVAEWGNNRIQAFAYHPFPCPPTLLGPARSVLAAGGRITADAGVRFGMTLGEAFVGRSVASGLDMQAGFWRGVHTPPQVGVDPGSRASPASFTLLSLGPNPFENATRLQYAVPRAARVRIRIFDPAGRVVRTVEDRWRPAGRYEISWDGRSSAGRKAGAGVYFCRAEVGSASATRRLVLIP